MNTMSEQSAAPVVDELTQLDPGDHAGMIRLIGRRLATARMAAGLGLDEVGARLKLPADRFAALEAGDWARLPDANFARALARSYAKLLQISIDDALARLRPPSAKPADPVAHHLGERYKPSYPSFRLASQVARPIFVLVAAVLGLLVVGGGWYLYRDISEVVPQSASTVPAEPLPLASIPAISNLASASDAIASAVSASNVESASPMPTAVELQLTESTWIQLNDATGQKLFNKQVVGAVVLPLTGSAPWQLVIGDVAMVGQIRWRGKPLDLVPYAGAKVARITLQ